jgi:chromosome segregation ATPase
MNTNQIQLPSIAPHMRQPAALLEKHIELLTEKVNMYEEKLYEADWFIRQTDTRIAGEVSKIQAVAQQQRSECRRLTVENNELRHNIRSKDKEISALRLARDSLTTETKLLTEETRRLDATIVRILNEESERVREAVRYAVVESEQREADLRRQLEEVTNKYNASLLLYLSSQPSV